VSRTHIETMLPPTTFIESALPTRVKYDASLLLSSSERVALEAAARANQASARAPLPSPESVIDGQDRGPAVHAAGIKLWLPETRRTVTGSTVTGDTVTTGTASGGTVTGSEDEIIESLMAASLNSNIRSRMQSLLDGLAAEFAMPFCLISFVHSSKSLVPFRHGTDSESFEHPGNGTQSFCQHVQSVKRPIPLIICDAKVDQRFMNNPLVVGPPSVRTYLGAPLRWLDGSYLGTVCLLDSRPANAPISFAQCEPLMRAADIVIQEYASVMRR